jgi:SNF2 family DNA or RNA helicase
MSTATAIHEEAQSEEAQSPDGLSGAYEHLLERLEAGQAVNPGASRLVDDALELWSRPGFDTFVSLPRLGFEPFPYQLAAAGAALRHMQGRAVLADEVGLGKTIEAALVASELRLRGLAPRILVLAPAGLVAQWREELDRKFALPSVEARAGWRSAGGPEEPIVLASLAAARRPPLRDALAGLSWDLVVVDEAHRVSNPRTASGRLVRALRSRHLLLLTATPVENRLSDLFHLVSLVRPGHLGTPAQFRACHGAGASAEGVRNLAGLRTRLAQVMIRHRRSEVALMLPRRIAQTRTVAPARCEAELYHAVSERVRAEGRGALPQRMLALRTVQRLAGSSPAALVPTLEKLRWSDLAAQAAGAGAGEKARTLVELLARHRAAGDKVVVFTAFRHTLEALAALAAEAGIPAVAYHGSLARRDKEAAIAAFSADADVLLTTEAAGEGRNLQFCSVMVNFDLPWNPMRIEQRLGRIHRIGQEREVLVTNLVARGTIEERILGVLQAKLNLFELVVGELDMILGRIEEDFDFESSVFDAHLASVDDADFLARLDALGDELAAARTVHLAGRADTDALVAEGGPAK